MAPDKRSRPAKRRAADLAWAKGSRLCLAGWAAGLRSDLNDAGEDQLDDVLLARTRQLLADFDLSGAGMPRAGRHAERTFWLYYDGELSVIAALMAAGHVVEPHNHGNWNVTGVAKGSVMYRGYTRLDDASRDNVADLRVAQESILRQGDAALCPLPPNDIHEVVCLEDETVSVLVAAPFDDRREYYMPDRRLYFHRSGTPEPALPDMKGGR